jgi:endoglucanase
MKQLKALLIGLIEADGVSGDEGREVLPLIEKTLRPAVDDLRVDRAGNLIVFKKGKRRPGKRLLLSAHMDEVGLIVKDADEKGFLSFEPVG